MKPHIRIVAGRPVTVPRGETKLERACRIYGRPFGRENWTAGSGPRFWTDQRIATLREQNIDHRQRRENLKARA